MKSKLFLILTSLFFTFYYGFAQKIVINGAETNRKLTWSDYTGAVDNSVPFIAYTGYLITTKTEGIKTLGDSIVIEKFEVTLKLDSIKSWAKKDKVTDELLIHEQGHFNIGILCMREILQVYKQTKFTKSNFNATIQNIFDVTLKKYNEMGVKYDEETEHFNNKKQQEKWNLFFAENLKTE